MALPARKTKTTTSRSQNGDSANTGAEAAGSDQSAETLRIPRRPRYSSRQIYEMTKAQLQAIDADVELRSTLTSHA